MSHLVQDRIFGTAIILIAAFWGNLAFRQQVSMDMDFRRDMTYVEHIITESAKAAKVSDQRDIWSRALLFEGDTPRIRGAKDGESMRDMTKRWIDGLRLPYWPSFMLTGIGILLWLPRNMRPHKALDESRHCMRLIARLTALTQQVSTSFPPSPRSRVFSAAPMAIVQTAAVTLSALDSPVALSTLGTTTARLVQGISPPELQMGPTPNPYGRMQVRCGAS